MLFGGYACSAVRQKLDHANGIFDRCEKTEGKSRIDLFEIRETLIKIGQKQSSSGQIQRYCPVLACVLVRVGDPLIQPISPLLKICVVKRLESGINSRLDQLIEFFFGSWWKSNRNMAVDFRLNQKDCELFRVFESA